MKLIKKFILVILLFGIIMMHCNFVMSRYVEEETLQNSSAYNSENIYAARNWGECTWYCWGRFYEVTGIKLSSFGDAKNWYDRVDPIYKSTTIQEHCIIVIGPTLSSPDGPGHVVFVEEINGSQVITTEGNADDHSLGGYKENYNISLNDCKIGNNYYGTRGGEILGFIVPGIENLGDKFTAAMTFDKQVAENTAVISADNTEISETKEINVETSVKNDLWEKNQLWNFERQSDGSYSIKNLENNLYLDVDYMGIVNGTNVKLAEHSDSLSQKWCIIKAKNEGYRLVPKHCYTYGTKRCLDFEVGEQVEDSNVRLWEFTGAEEENKENQIIHLQKTLYVVPQDLGTNFTATMVFDDQTIGSAAVLAENGETNESNVEISTQNGIWKKNQLWDFEKQEDGTYYIKNLESNLYLDVEDGDTINDTNIRICNKSDASSQKWFIVKIGEKYRLIPKNCYENGISSCLNITDGNKISGTNVRLWEFEGDQEEEATNQLVDIQKTYYCEAENLGEDFTATMIFNKDVPESAAVIATDGITNESNVELSTQDGMWTQNQIWNFERQSDESYCIKNTESNLYLDVENEETSNTTNIKISDKNTSSSQKWYIVKVDDKYRLIPKHCYDKGIKSCLDIEESETTSGTNVRLMEFEGNPEDESESQTLFIQKSFYCVPEDIGTDFTATMVFGQGTSGNTAVISADGTENESNVEISLQEGTWKQNQLWYFEKQSDNTYCIKNVESNLYLDLDNEQVLNNTNINIGNKSTSASQKWYIVNTDGKYRLIPKICYDNGVKGCLDIEDGETSSGTNVRLMEFEGNSEDSSESQGISLQNAYYCKAEDLGANFSATMIFNKGLSDNSAVIATNGTTNGSNVEISTQEGMWKQNQIWNFERQSDESYYIRNAESNLYLNVNNSATDNNTNIEISDQNDSTSQKWYIVKVNDKYRLIPKNCYDKGIKSGLNIEEGGVTSGTNVHLLEFENVTEDSSENQILDIQKAFYCVPEDIGTDFTATMIFNQENLENAAVISTNGKTEESNAEISTREGTWEQNQLWTFERQSDKTYCIKNVESNLYLDIDNQGTTKGTNIKISNKNDSTSQKWYMVKVNERYRLIPKNCYDNGVKCCLDIADGGTTPGTNIRLWEFEGNADNNSANQVISLQNAYYCKPENLGANFSATMIFNNEIPDKAVVIASNGTESQNNVEISIQDGMWKQNQIWNFEQQSDESYCIKNVESNLYLNVENEGTSNDTNINIENQNNSSSQKWYIVKVDDKYRLIPQNCYDKGIKACIDIENGETDSGTNIHLWGFEGNSNDSSENQILYIQKAFYCVSKDLGNSFTAAMIFNKGDNSAVIATDGATNGSNAEISIQEGMWKQNQLWNFEKQSDGTYYIKNYESNLYLDLDNQEMSNGTNIKICEQNNSPSQKWYIVEIDGKYRLIPKKCYDNGVKACLDVNGGGITSGTNIRLWEFEGNADDNSANQVIYIQNAYYCKPENLGADFTATMIFNKGLSDNSAVIATNGATNGSNAEISVQDGMWKQNQIWNFERQSDESYYIKNVESNLYLNVNNGETDNNTNIEISDKNDSTSQKWYIVKVNDKYRLIPKNCYDKGIKACLDIENGGTGSGTNVHLLGFEGNSDDSSEHQVLYIQKAFYCVSKDLGDNFTATMIFNKESTDNASVISASDRTNDSNVEISKQEGTWSQNQLWDFEKQSDGTYYIKSYESNLYLDSDNQEMSNGTNIKICEQNNSPSQKWYIVEIDGKYRLIPKKCYDNGVKACLDVDGGGITSGTNVRLWEFEGNADDNSVNQVIYIQNSYYCLPEDLGKVFSATMIFNKEMEENVAVIATNGTTDGSNVEISMQDESLKQEQLWIFERQNDGSYYIKNFKSNLYLDVDNQATTNDANIKISEYSDSTSQKWYIVKVGDKYRLIPKHCYDNGISRCLDVNNGGTVSGTNVHLWDFSGKADEEGNTQTIYIEKEIYKLGDINQDGWVNINDVNYGMRGIVNKITLTELEKQIGNVNKDEIFNINDINMIMQSIVDHNFDL